MVRDKDNYLGTSYQAVNVAYLEMSEFFELGVGVRGHHLAVGVDIDTGALSHSKELSI